MRSTHLGVFTCFLFYGDVFVLYAFAFGIKKEYVLKILRRFVAICFGFFLLVCIVVLGYFFYVVKNAEPIDATHIYDNLSQRTIVYDDKGKEIDVLSLADGNRTLVDYDDIPETMINAIVSIEDKTFWEHHGFNVIRLLGAMKNALLYDSEVSGTSTITQQLARNAFLSDIKSERTLSRKVKEAYYAVELEK